MSTSTVDPAAPLPGPSHRKGGSFGVVVAGADALSGLQTITIVAALPFVVVMVGPNDLSWTDLLKYCYAVENCQDRLTQGEFGYRLDTAATSFEPYANLADVNFDADGFSENGGAAALSGAPPESLRGSLQTGIARLGTRTRTVSRRSCAGRSSCRPDDRDAVARLGTRS